MTNRHSLALTLLLTLFAGAACTPLPTPPAQTPQAVATDDVFDFNDRLGRGINLGNALEAPYEGARGLYLQEEFFEEIAAAGFSAVRVPIRWSAYAGSEAPYAIDERIFQRVDWVIEQAMAVELVAVVNIHHYAEIMSAPEQQRERFTAIWRQIAEHYADAPETVYFELLNEPNEKMTPAVWNSLLADALSVVRESNPDRTVIVGPVEWNNVDLLTTLDLPEDDHNLIGTFHYYRPFEFTHQGADWVAGADAWLGAEWTGSAAQRAAIARDFDRAARWSEEAGRPVYVGEFGAYSRADMASRALWTAAVVEAAEARGFSWAYWEFGSGFGAYNRALGQWETPLLDALMPE